MSNTLAQLVSRYDWDEPKQDLPEVLHYTKKRYLDHLTSAGLINLDAVESIKNEITNEVLGVLGAKQKVGKSSVEVAMHLRKLNSLDTLDEYKAKFLASLNEETFLELSEEIDSKYAEIKFEELKNFTEYINNKYQINLGLIGEFAGILRDSRLVDWVPFSIIIETLKWEPATMSFEQKYAIWELMTTDPRIGGRVFKNQNWQSVAFYLKGDIPVEIDIAKGNKAITDVLWNELFGSDEDSTEQ
jgi:hypothetical protein